MRRTLIVAVTVVLGGGVVGVLAQARRGAAAPGAAKPCTLSIDVSNHNVTFPSTNPKCESTGTFTLTVNNHDSVDWTVTVGGSMKNTNGDTVQVLPNDVTVTAQAKQPAASSSPATVNQVAKDSYSYTFTMAAARGESIRMDPDIDVQPPSSAQVPKKKK